MANRESKVTKRLREEEASVPFFIWLFSPVKSWNKYLTIWIELWANKMQGFTRFVVKTNSRDIRVFGVKFWTQICIRVKNLTSCKSAWEKWNFPQLIGLSFVFSYSYIVSTHEWISSYIFSLLISYFIFTLTSRFWLSPPDISVGSWCAI